MTVSGEVDGDSVELAYPKARHGLGRIVMVAQRGSISLAAVRWLQGAGVPLLHVDRDGGLLAAVGVERAGDGRLRRAQALAFGKESGLTIARHVIGRKLDGQAANLAALGRDPSPSIEAAGQARAAGNLAAVTLAESMGAEAYWRMWEGFPIRFTNADRKHVPPYWNGYVQRGSPLTGSPRLAVDPANAILNYLYSILEAETTIACRAIGLDPMLGVIHVDATARGSLSLDVMETVRPIVDAYVIRLLDSHTFRRRDFAEGPDGRCRIRPPLRDLLAGTGSTWRQAVAPEVEAVAAILAEGTGLPRPPSLLTGQARRAARPVNRRRRPAGRIVVGRPVNVCRECGEPIPRDRVRCGACANAVEIARLATLRDGRWIAVKDGLQQDPSHGGEAASRRGKAVSARARERAGNPLRESPSGLDRVTAFRRDVLPMIEGVPVSELVRRSGLSESYVRLVRRGLRVPDPRWWDVLALSEEVDTIR